MVLKQTNESVLPNVEMTFWVMLTLYYFILHCRMNYVSVQDFFSFLFFL